MVKNKNCSKIKLANWGLKDLSKIQTIPNWGDNWPEIIIDILIFPQHIMGGCENSFN